MATSKDEYVIVIRSDGAGVRANYPTIPIENAFTAEIDPAAFEDNQEYVLALHSIEYDSVAAEALKVNCDLVEPTRQGNQKLRTLYRIPAAKATGGSIALDEFGTVPLWIQMTNYRQVREINIELLNDTTNAVSTSARSVPTIVTLVIKHREFI